MFSFLKSNPQSSNEGSAKAPFLMIQFFQWESRGTTRQSWWQHFEEEVPSLAAMGVDTVWLPPPTKAMSGQRSCGYDAYDLWDLGEFDQKGTVQTRWGTRSELEHACGEASSHQIRVLVDAVLNHKFGADGEEYSTAVPVSPTNRLKATGPERKIKAWLKYNFSGRHAEYSGFRWDARHFSGVDYDTLKRQNGVFRLTGNGHKGWSTKVDTELGNYDYLMGSNIDHRNAEARRELFNWGNWVLEAAPFDGFRLDAIKHIDHDFLSEFVQECRRHKGGSSFVVAEYWSDRLEALQRSLRSFNHQICLFDVPLHYNFHNASRLRSQYDLRRILSGTLVRSNPGCAVTFVDNHDTQPGQSLQSWVEDWFKPLAYAIILLLPYGIPCLFYGDLYPDQHLHQPNTAAKIRVLISLRQTIAVGPIQAFWGKNPNILGFVRKGLSKKTGCAVLLNNNYPSEDFPHGGGRYATLEMNVGKGKADLIYRDIFGNGEPAIIGGNGAAIFRSSGPGINVWIPSQDPGTLSPHHHRPEAFN